MALVCSIPTNRALSVRKLVPLRRSVQEGIGVHRNPQPKLIHPETARVPLLADGWRGGSDGNGRLREGSTREQDPAAQEWALKTTDAERVFADHGESSRVADRPQ